MTLSTLTKIVKLLSKFPQNRLRAFRAVNFIMSEITERATPLKQVDTFAFGPLGPESAVTYSLFSKLKNVLGCARVMGPYELAFLQNLPNTNPRLDYFSSWLVYHGEETQCTVFNFFMNLIISRGCFY